MSWLRCRPFAFWLVFAVLGVSFVGLSGLFGGELHPRPYHQPVSSAELAVMVPDVISAAGAGDGSVTTVVEAFSAKALELAHVAELRGGGRAADAYREVATYARTVTAAMPPAEARWRAEALGRAVSALGVGSLDPVTDEAWAGPPAPAPTTTVAPAAQRVLALLPADG